MIADCSEVSDEASLSSFFSIFNLHLVAINLIFTLEMIFSLFSFSSSVWNLDFSQSTVRKLSHKLNLIKMRSQLQCHKLTISIFRCLKWARRSFMSEMKTSIIVAQFQFDSARYLHFPSRKKSYDYHKFEIFYLHCGLLTPDTRKVIAIPSQFLSIFYCATWDAKEVFSPSPTLQPP